MSEAGGMGRRSPASSATLGVIEREVLSTRPVAIRYRITPLGKTLRRPVDVLLAWAAEQMPAIERARDAYDAREEADI